MQKPDDDLLKKWNKILAKQKLETVRPGKATWKTQKDQRRSKKKGVPAWGTGGRK